MGVKRKGQEVKKKGLGVKKIGVGLKKRVWGLKKRVTLFYTVVAADVPIELRSSWQPGSLAAADAYAEGGCAGIGGWWLPANCALTPENLVLNRAGAPSPAILVSMSGQ